MQRSVDYIVLSFRVSRLCPVGDSSIVIAKYTQYTVAISILI